ncbi:MAG: 50S ribosomal protein L35 [Firmicutes bacterium]|nr:50S ribosomal protein L35 [Bacillota bacterium]
MAKMKTHKGAAKRLGRTGTGKLKKNPSANRSHLLGHKSPKRKRQLRKAELVHQGEAKRLKRALPYW